MRAESKARGPAKSALDAALEKLRADAERGRWTQERRQEAVERHEADFAQSFPEGTAIVVHLDTFEIVTCDTPVGALKQFAAAFGMRSPGWAFEVGRPLVLSS